MQPSLPVQYEELTATDFPKAVEQSAKTCVIPLGILEKHGPHLPLGTDMINIRALVVEAAKREYAVVFPPYFVGQIYEAKHQPGTIAYSHDLVWIMLQETCDELARNGFEKILLVNGHGGNNSFLEYFCQAQLETEKNYAVFLYQPRPDEALNKKISEKQKSAFDYHAGEGETSLMTAHHPDPVKSEYVKLQSGEDQKRLNHLQGAKTGIWWYARFPNHYAGDAHAANAELGRMIFEHKVEQLIPVIKAVKADNKTLELQKTFFEQSKHSLKSPQR